MADQFKLTLHREGVIYSYVKFDAALATVVYGSEISLKYSNLQQAFFCNRYPNTYTFTDCTRTV